MDLETIYEEFPMYRGLKPTTKAKKDYKNLYKEIQKNKIDLGEFPNKQARGLNQSIIQEIGEFPYWEKGNNAAVPLGKGEVHKMSAGEPRPVSVRNVSQEKSFNKRNQILKEADELMIASGYKKEVKEGKKLYNKQDRSGGMSLDHEYETQEFGSDYERLKKKFAAKVISETQFKKELNDIVSRGPGSIKSNLTLKTEAENYAKMAKTRGVIKDKNLAEKYKVRDASYTNKIAAFTKNLNKVNLLNGVHAYAKQFLEGQKQGYDTSFNNKNGKVNGNGTVNGNGKVNGNGNGKKIVLNGNKTNNYRGLSTLMEHPNSWSDPLLATPLIKTLDKSIQVDL